MYDLIELAKQCPEINFTIKASDLLDVIEKTARQTKAEFLEHLNQKEEQLITVSEASKILNVDRSSLWRWAKSGYLAPVEIGGKRKYKMSDILKITDSK